MNAPTLTLMMLTLPALFLTGGCAQAVPSPAALVNGPLSFLKPGESETDLLLRLGAPSGDFEKEHILTWRLGRTDNGTIAPASRVVLLYGDPDDSGSDWQGTLYDLVVVFDDQGLLKQFNLIPVIDG
jgi:hypothetical protein